VTLGRVLVTGGGGQLASDLGALLRERTEVLAPSRQELDITDDRAVASTLERFQPLVVFNCAAFHNVDLCEREEERALRVNCVAVKRLAERCARADTLLVQLSTNYVFDGRQRSPYTENDPQAPRSVYGISKLAGEHMALAFAPMALVVRTAGLYGRHGSSSKGGNFITRMLVRAKEQGELHVVDDQRLTPTYTADLATALIEAVEVGCTGVLHLTNAGECSWFEFAQAILARAGVEVPVKPVATEVAPGRADRPMNGVLARQAADTAGLKPLRDWRKALDAYMRDAGLVALETPSETRLEERL
jgi:dTDP-4-dehydrorhamnose reductase